MRKVLVMHLLSSSRFSGAENVVCQIVNAFNDDLDIEMVYCSPDGPIRQSLATQEVRFEPLVSLSFAELRRVIRKVQPSVIHAHDMRASFLASIAAPKTLLISHIHNNNFNSRGLSLKSILYSYAAAKASHIFWVSQAAYDGYFFHKFYKNKSSVLHNVIDISCLYQRAAESTASPAYDIVYIGRLNYLKNPLRLVSILVRLHEINPSAKSAILGDGELREDVVKKIHECHMESSIAYLGFLENPYCILKKAKCMVMTSRTEGLPMCALEAMSLGVPLVSTPVGGLVELVNNGVDGILSNDDNEIVSNLNRIITDRDYRIKLSMNAKTKMENTQNLEYYRQTLLNAYIGKKMS